MSSTRFFLKVSLFLFVALAAFPVSAQVAPNFKGDFQYEQRFSAGTSPIGVATGDLNGDGRADLAVTDYNGLSVSVLLGNGDGTFGSPTSYSVGDHPYAVTLADVNGDGHLDIVCASLNLAHLALGGTVSVLLGKGDGTFAPAVNYVAGKNLSSLALADFNGDGHVDIATSDVSSGNVAILLNNGDGTFRSAVQYPAGPNPFSLGVGDFNGDGKADLVVTNLCDVSQSNFNCTSYQTTVTILLGRGDGTFSGPVSYESGYAPEDLVVADFNSDGKEDLAISTFGSDPSSVSLMLGNGDGTFQGPKSYPVGGTTYGLAVGDFNSDGTLDLVAASVNGGLAELLGTGNGSFDAAVQYFVSLSLGARPAIADLNGDGLPDLVLGDGNVIDVFLNAGSTNRQATSTTVSSSQTSVGALSPLAVTAAVSPAAALQGSVTFYVDGQPVIPEANPPLGQPDSSGQVIFQMDALPFGTHHIAAIYSGDTSTEGSTSGSLTQTIAAIPTTTTLAASPNPSLTDQSVTLTATVGGGLVGDIGPEGSSNGSVTSFDGSTVLGTVPVTPNDQTKNWQVMLTVSNLSAGTHAITVAYGSSPYFAPSVSAALQQVVNGNLNLSIASGSASSVTVTAGQSAQYSLTIGGSGFGGQATLTCAGAPAGASCSVTPASLMVNATAPVALGVTVTTSARGSGLQWRIAPLSLWIWVAILLGPVASLFGARCKRSGGKLSFLSLCLLLLLISWCGGCSNGGTSGNARTTHAGTYTISVQAISGSASASLPLTLTVQ